MKKTISLLLAFLLLLSTHSVVFASETNSSANKRGTTGFCIWELYDDGTLVIQPDEQYISNPLYGRMGFYSYSSPPWKDDVKKLIIKDGVVYIGNCAFSSCKKLTDITIADSVTSIATGAFDYSAYYYDENKWKDNVLYNGAYLLSSKEDISGICKIKEGTRVIADYAFSTNGGNDFLDKGRENLHEVVFPNSLKIIGYASFYRCRNLNKIYLPEGITTIREDAFRDCDSLKSVIIPSTVSSIEKMSLGYYSFFNRNYYETDKIDGFTIYGVKGSEAERYANENGFIFKEIGSESSMTTGDVNGDDVVDILDATVIQKFTVDKASLTDEQKAAADVNGDNVVDILDATDIQKFTVDKITEFKK